MPPDAFKSYAPVDNLLVVPTEAASLSSNYDALDRLVARDAFNHETHEKHVTFTYDAVGNLLTASNETARLSFSYDVMGRLTSAVTWVSGLQFPVAYAYDLGGLCTNVVYPGGRAVRYGYDADGRVTNVTDWAGHTWTFTRDAAGRLTALSCPNGVTGAWTHDANHAVASWSWSAGGLPFAGRVITRDEAGVKTKEQVTAGLFPNPQNPRRAVNTFDAADRLVSATVAQGTNTCAETYLYDLNGALTNTVSGSESVFDAAYNALGQLTSLDLWESVPSVDYSYDPIGNRIVCGNRLWIPDHADSLKRPLMECDLSGNVLRYFVWGNSRLLGFIDAASGALTVVHCDEYGSVVALTDEAGNVLHQACYGPYGEDWGSAGANPTPFAWLGGYGVFNVGGSSLYLTRHRLYSATLCRFLSQDPLGLDGGPNLYAYCLGNPLAYIDPQGLAISAAASGVARAIDTVWNFGIQFATFNPNATPQMQEAMYQANLSSFGSPMQRLFGAYDTPASQPITIAPEIVSSAWGTTAAMSGVMNIGAQGVAPLGTVVSPYVTTAWGPATQSSTPAAQAAVQQIQSGVTIYRTGGLGTQAAAEAQFWSLQNPATTANYASQMGMPSTGNGPVFIMGGTINSGSFITREAPGIGANLGGGLEVVVPPNGVKIQWFHMP